MFLPAITFLLGDLYLQTLSQLPSHTLLYTGLIVSGLLGWMVRAHRSAHFLFVFVLGFSYAAWYAEKSLSWQLPLEWEDHPQVVTGKVISIPIEDMGIKHFLFLLKKPDALIRLSWKTKQQIAVGEVYRFTIKLKRIHGTQNPGGFDMEAWALQKGVRAAGVVMPSSQVIKLHISEGEWINRLRQAIHDRALTHLPRTPSAPWLLALMMGERSEVKQQDWQVLRNTGTNHLMAIGGLHIGMMAALFCWMVGRLWRRLPRLMLFLPAQQAGMFAGFIVAVFYAILSGLAVPAERASLMLSIFVFAALYQRQATGWQVWSLAMLISLLINPLTVLDNSFWLSFGTIALIIYGMSGRLAPVGPWWRWGRVQWVVGVGLIPMTLLFFQQTSLVSFIANSIAIPWLGFLILPFCFLSTIFLFIHSGIATLLLWLAGKSLEALWFVLSFLSSQSFAVFTHPVSSIWMEGLLIVGFVLLLLPVGMRERWLGLVCVFPLFFWQIEKPKQGEVWMTLLDVGQGLSIVVQTRQHLLVFDAGPAVGKMNMGERVVLPYLRTLGVRQLDMLVVSHADNDHRGGANVILSEIPAKRIKTSVPDKFPSPVTSYCLAGTQWKWDEVHFEFLSPFSDTLNLGNNSSCILKISTKNNSILLTGDIEKEGESILLQRQYPLLKSTILVAPHHGSNTSSTPAFVSAVHPLYTLYATGYRNRYHFPHAPVVREYKKIGAHELNTMDAGAIQFKINQDGIGINKYRLDSKRYWYEI